MAGEMHAVRIDGTTTATVRCEDSTCPFKEDAHDVAEVQTVLADAAMHAMAAGHRVVEHIAKDVTISPVAEPALIPGFM